MLMTPVSPPAQDKPGNAIEESLALLFAGEDLSAGQAEHVFAELVAGRLDEPTMAALLIALKIKGEVVDELIGAARALRAADLPFDRPDYLFADCCGTGGDGSGTINLSTATAFVSAAAGLPVAKHGNRSVTSRCGSADVLQKLGVRLDLDPSQARRSLDETGICFLFAPQYHPGLRHAGPVRRALKVRTIMNIVGPCVNPAEPSVQLLGVAEPRLLVPVAMTLAALGVERALVVHGGGLDEVALHAETQAARLVRGRIERIELSPELAGLRRAPLDVLRGGAPEENAARLEALLAGRGSESENDAVALNVAALLIAAERVKDLREGVGIARERLHSGAGLRVLRSLVEVSHA
jgi:anthranilate phosphoribosyltransferase